MFTKEEYYDAAEAAIDKIELSNGTISIRLAAHTAAKEMLNDTSQDVIYWGRVLYEKNGVVPVL